MSKIKNYGKRMKLFFAGAAIVAGMCIMMSVPWAKGFAWTSSYHSKSEIYIGDPANNFQNRQLAEDTSPHVQ